MKKEDSSNLINERLYIRHKLECLSTCWTMLFFFLHNYSLFLFSLIIQSCEVLLEVILGFELWIPSKWLMRINLTKIFEVG
jgi:hypothetical protein